MGVGMARESIVVGEVKVAAYPCSDGWFGNDGVGGPEAACLSERSTPSPI